MTHPTCKRPDRHVARLVCGYPLPCPWHTAGVVDVERGRISNPTGDERLGRRLGTVLDALTPTRRRDR